jgi:uncharacterized protein with HEPN domain
MSRGYRIYLNDILASIKKIYHFVDDLEFDEFTRDEKTVDAVLYNLFIVGEAVKQIPSEVRSKHAEIEWRRIAGLRDIIAHEYFRVDLDIIWNIVKEELPILLIQIETLAKQADHPEGD